MGFPPVSYLLRWACSPYPSSLRRSSLKSSGDLGTLSRKGVSRCPVSVQSFRSISTSPPQPASSVKSSRSLSTSRQPLDGITVVSLEQAIAAPFCTRQLADVGARIIKVERPEGDFARNYDDRVNGMCSHFTWVNRSKESLALDLKDPTDLSILKTLLLNVDVLVQNLAPGASERMGLSYEKLSKLNPRLIVCDISGYGSYGPYRDKKAYDLLVQSESGFLSVSGTPETPSKAGCSIADIAAGMYAYSNIMAALLQRHHTGEGGRLDISMLESMVEWMTFPLYYSYNDAPPPPRAGASHAAIYPYGPFRSGDGGSVMLGIQNEREWARFCEIALEDPSLAADPRFSKNKLRSENREELKKIIEASFLRSTADEVVARLDKAGIANAFVRDMKGVWEHPQLKARNRWTEVRTPLGVVPALMPPGQAVEWGTRMDPIPRVGEHNEKILRELGLKKQSA